MEVMRETVPGASGLLYLFHRSLRSMSRKWAKARLWSWRAARRREEVLVEVAWERKEELEERGEDMVVLWLVVVVVVRGWAGLRRVC